MDQLTPLHERAVLHFGNMAREWGMSRTEGQVYGLLFLMDQPLNADQIMHLLALSRSNVGAALNALQASRLIAPVPQLGDRREYFSVPGDVWQALHALALDKRRRELEPTLQFLQVLMQEAPYSDAPAYVRLRSLYDLLDLMDRWFADVQKLSPATLTRLMRLGSRVARVLDAAPPRRDG